MIASDHESDADYSDSGHSRYKPDRRIRKKRIISPILTEEEKKIQEQKKARRMDQNRRAAAVYRSKTKHTLAKGKQDAAELQQLKVAMAQALADLQNEKRKTADLEQNLSTLKGHYGTLSAALVQERRQNQYLSSQLQHAQSPMCPLTGDGSSINHFFS